MIVNYQHYREIRDEEARREYFRDAKRKQREGKKKRGGKPNGKHRNQFTDGKNIENPTWRES